MPNAPSTDTRVVRVLLVEDSREDRETFGRLLATAREFTCDVVTIDTGADGLEVCRSDPPDVLLLDVGLPDMNGLEVLAEMSSEGLLPDLPVIVLTGRGDERLAVDAMRLGAQDYLVKGEVNGPLIVRSIRYAIERHALIAELRRRAQREAAVQSQFLSHVSQELRAPLSPIQQFLTVLRGGATGELNAKQHEYLDLIRRNVHRLREMIDQLIEAALLDLGTLEVHPTSVNIRPLVDSCVVTLLPRAAAKDVRLESSITQSLPPVAADPARVEQILTSLITNAINFTEACGEILVRVEPDRDDPSFVRVSVQDTGAGIPETRAREIFERLRDHAEDGRERKGLGLGLYLARELTELQGGRIWADTSVEKGASIHFTLRVSTGS